VFVNIRRRYCRTA